MIIFLYVLFGILLVNYGAFLFHIITGLKRVTKTGNKIIPHEFISIIVPFRNERENILRNLESLENQNYPADKFEIIYVDDNSTDGSFELLNSGRKKSNLKILKLADSINTISNKKRAIQFGIENSCGSIIVTTDADCTYKQKWLKTLLSEFDSQTVFISGPVEFEDSSSIFGKTQLIEFEGLVLAGAGLIGYGKPAICNGANIAYRKKLFNQLNGFEDNFSISSGDDVLLMQKAAIQKQGKIKFCWNNDALVSTGSNQSLRDFMNQRKRWAGKGFAFPDKFLVFQLIIIFLFYAGLLIQTFLALFMYPLLWLTLIISVFIKMSMEYYIIKKGESLFSIKTNILIFILTELMQVPYIILSVLNGLFGKFEWKDRKFKKGIGEKFA